MQFRFGLFAYKDAIGFLEGIAGISVLRDLPGDNGTWPYFILRLPDEARRDPVGGELASAGRSLKLILYAEMTYKAMQGHTMWLGAGWSESRAE